MSTIDSLIHARHITFVRALESGFQNTEITEAWREANRAYVRARMGNSTRLKPSVGGTDRATASAAA